MSFRGIIAERKYTWGYECEHCNKSVVKEFVAATRIGQDAKASTWTYVTPDGEKSMISQALNQLSNECKSIDSFWTRRSDDDQWLDGIKDDGICPHCKKHQHWAPAVRKAGKDGGKKSSVGGTIALIFGTILISLIAWVVL